MSFELALGTLFVAGCVLSYFAWRFERVTSAAWFRWGGLGLWVFFLILIRVTIGQPQVYHIIMIVVAGVSWIPFIVFFIVNTIASVARKALSEDNITVRPFYSLAEAAQARGNLDEALRLYRQAVQEYPAEAEPCRRIGELYLKLGQPDLAIRAFREAEERCPSAEDKAMHVFSIAETLADRKGDLAAAIQTLERYRAEYPNAAAVAYAEQRIKLLRERQEGGNRR